MKALKIFSILALLLCVAAFGGMQVYADSSSEGKQECCPTSCDPEDCPGGPCDPEDCPKSCRVETYCPGGASACAGTTCTPHGALAH